MIYFDHNASTPVRPEVQEEMGACLADLPANPSSLHREGQRARAALEKARGHVATLVGASADEVTFVSGGTEGDHAGLIGAALALEKRGRRVAISAIEHHAVHGAAHLLARLGFAVEHLRVGRDGMVDPRAAASLPPDTTVVAVMMANNETGVIQPVAEVAARAREAGLRTLCDAVQAAGKIPVDFEGLGVAYLVVSAHKLGGPKGVGALIVRHGAPFEPLFRGSAHEFGRRGGTENVPGIVGFGVAAELAAREVAAESQRLRRLRARFEAGVRAYFPGAIVHGERAPRLPNTVNASFPGARSDHLLMSLDARGVAVSAGAACASGAVEPSPVLSAMGVPRELAVCALRFSMGRTTSEHEVDEVIAALVESVKAARAMGKSGTGARA
ncbi:MAG: cysteine desulfurase [Candidatus Eisenbacteria bacterium]|nr:cysteine desulfurase [Candidatus Eisenbacteria bacterium]